MGFYRDEAHGDAQDAAGYFLDEIVEDILSEEGRTDKMELIEYSDTYHHEHHVDRSYRLKEAAELIEELYEFEEGDTGLWSGLQPKEAIEAMAAYTYGNAVASMFRYLMEKINEAITDAEGDTLFWSAQDWVEGVAVKTGVLEWLPTEKWEALNEEVREEMEEKYQEKLRGQVKSIVKEVIKNW